MAETRSLAPIAPQWRGSRKTARSFFSELLRYMMIDRNGGAVVRLPGGEQDVPINPATLTAMEGQS